MNQRYILLFVFLFFLPLYVQAQSSLEFVENRGQWDGSFLYKSVTGKGDVYLEKNCFTYVIGKPDNQDMVDAYHHGQIKNAPVLKFHAYKMIFEDAGTPTITGSKEQKYYYNYFLGNNPSRWKTEIHPYLGIDYKDLYSGIDVRVASEKGNLKYDFIVQPGSDAKQIKLKFEGVDNLKIKDGNLIIQTSVGAVTELQPFAYQYVNGERKEIDCKYKLRGEKISYNFPKGYDETQILIIDPTVVFSTFTGSTADNWGFTATYDNAGNFYAGGLVHGVGFPVNVGAFQTTFGGGIQSGTFVDSTHGSDYASDIGIIKFNPTGTAKIYATYLGGLDNDQPHSLIVDANDNLIVAGRTYSNNFPVTSNAFDTSYNGGADIIVTKFNAAGTALLGSTYLGGTNDDGVNFNALETVSGALKYNYGDDARSEVIVDQVGNIYLTACTRSTNYPTTANAYQASFQGVQDAILAKFNSTLSSLTYSSFLGGSDYDAGYVLGLDGNGSHLYVGGGTQSPNFPVTSGTLWPSYQGGSGDGFILRFSNAAPYNLVNGTFIGQTNLDQVYGIQIDIDNDVYAMGQSLGGNFPVHNAGYSNPNSCQFVIKLDPSLSTNIYSTVFGSGDPTVTNISPVAFLVDTCKNVYISGWGGNLGLPGPSTVGTTTGMPITPNNIVAPAKATTDGSDFYFIVLSRDVQALLYGAFFGRTSPNPGQGEHVDGGTSRFDKNGIIYQAICAGCAGSAGATPFPTTAGSYSPNNGNPSNCNEAAVKIAFEFILKAKAGVLPDTSGCLPFTVQFQNNSSYAVSYLWDFGDGSPLDTQMIPSPHTYTSAGTYIVKLYANNANACNAVKDTAFITIVVDSNFIKSNFNYTVTDSCKKPYKVSFNNTSLYSNTPGSQNFTSFYWDFGDGTSFTGTNPPVHNYNDTGSYIVTLLMVDTTSCNNQDSIKKIIHIQNTFVKAAFNADSSCLGSGILFSNFSENAQTNLWDFGDGKTATSSSPVHVFDSAGSYTVTLIVTNPNACNKSDTAIKTIKVKSLPVANFAFTPLIPIPNMPVQFTNLSYNAVSYQWAFGDGTGSAVEHPVHLYKKTGTYKVCLEARSKDGCLDTVCKFVDADIHPAVDVPTGFSPNGDGVNDILYVKGAAIEKLNFKVYNRFGELVFETTDINNGWDGVYKGKPQEMEAYGWVLDVTFVDESTFHKTGNVTLLR